MTSWKTSLALFTVSTAVMAAVTGKTVEKLGVQWQQSYFKGWATNPDALITPETTNLASQYCLRNTQENLDGKAYDDLAVPLAQEMKRAFKGKSSAIGKGLANLAEVIEKIQGQEFEQFTSPDKYIESCNKLVGTEVKARLQALYPLYEGRMSPKVSKSAPEAIKQKIAELAKRGVKVAPLDPNGLAESICFLEGYYSTSYDQRLWKFFSTTRAMANVLPSEANEEEFVRTLKAEKKIVDLIHSIDVYSSVAGRSNGLSIGMNEEEAELSKKSTPARLTGVALGSAETALMSFFTTAWRERLQDHVLQVGYPEKPFKLISLDQVLEAVQMTSMELAELKDGDRKPSQTEVGMDVVWKNLSGGNQYGAATESFKRTAALAWLAINAETNIRQNEKLGAVAATAIPQTPPTTRNVYADEAAYQGIIRELDAALAGYRLVDPKDELSSQLCVGEVRKFVETAAKASHGKQGVVLVASSDTELFADPRYSSSFEFLPLIADIGGELKDDNVGIAGQKDFKLHLATGYWRDVPTSIGGKKYVLGTPSAFVLHLKDTTNTAQWQHGMVMKVDKQ